MNARLNRRSAITVIGAGLAAGCATTIERLAPPVLVNLADQAPPAADDTAQLGSAADSARRMTAPVHINGQGPFDFVIDTGANRTVVSRELATALAMPAAGKAQMVRVEVGVEEPAVPEVSANKYYLNIRFTNPPAGELKAKVAERDVPFALTFCNL